MQRSQLRSQQLRVYPPLFPRLVSFGKRNPFWTAGWSYLDPTGCDGMWRLVVGVTRLEASYFHGIILWCLDVLGCSGMFWDVLQFWWRCGVGRRVYWIIYVSTCDTFCSELKVHESDHILAGHSGRHGVANIRKVVGFSLSPFNSFNKIPVDSTTMYNHHALVFQHFVNSK